MYGFVGANATPIHPYTHTPILISRSASTMKVILQRDIPKVGKHGDVVNVADGYARNYLLPRQLAVSASGGALKAHQSRMELEKGRSAKQLGDAQSQGEK